MSVRGIFPISPGLAFKVGFIAFPRMTCAFEFRSPAYRLESPSQNMAFDAELNRNPLGSFLIEKAPLVIEVQERPGLKMKSKFKLTARIRPLSCSSVCSRCPSFSQLTTSSKFPYHFLYSPPLAYGNHRRRDFCASSRDLLNPISFIETSCHPRTKNALSPVAIPFRVAQWLEIKSPLSKDLIIASDSQ